MPGVGGADSDDFMTDAMPVKWELDPDYADSLLLQDEYDHATLHKNKKQIWKDITAHNKAAKIATDDIGSIINFLKTLKSGDIIWTSNVSHYMIRDVKSVPRAEANKLAGGVGMRIKGPIILVVNMVDKKGVARDITADFFYHKALYKERPRAYKELNL
jgi:hypothetical protein